MEWASLPVLADSQGDRQRIRRGQSYYAGDGLNRALCGRKSWKPCFAAVAGSRSTRGRGGPRGEAAALVVPARPGKPVSRSGRFWTWVC